MCVQIRACMHACRLTHASPCGFTCSYIYAHAGIVVCSHWQAFAHSHTCLLTWREVCVPPLAQVPNTHMQSCTHMHAHTYKRAHVGTCILAYRCMYILTCAACMGTYVCTRMHMHAHMCIHAFLHLLIKRPRWPLPPQAQRCLEPSLPADTQQPCAQGHTHACMLPHPVRAGIAHHQPCMPVPRARAPAPISHHQQGQAGRQTLAPSPRLPAARDCGTQAQAGL